MKNIALYGGAFSPPHLGHASVIEGVLRLFPCDEIWIMPSADRHDKKVSASGEDRISMLEILIKELFPNPKTPILFSDFELKMNKPTVTYKTLQALDKKYPGNKFYFVLGSENLNVIATKWINGEKLLQERNFLAIKNPNVPLSDELSSNIAIIDDIPWTNVSSTFVRKLIAQGQSGLPYISKGVAEYIKSHNLYK